jgi:enediyne biosynthesis protein E3
MTTTIGRLRGRLLGIPPEETTFSKRGFHSLNDEARDSLEQVGRAFVHGYHAAIEESDLVEVVTRLELVEQSSRGFAYEGAAMAVALIDGLTPWKRSRIDAFLNGPAARHRYMVHVGVGWAMARLPRTGKVASAPPLDPLLRWLVFDGYGFHQAYFHPQRFVDRQEPSRFCDSYAARVVDQGIGRALWFVNGADPDRIARVAASFPAARRPDLWSGIGLAATYAGGIGQAGLEMLRDAAGPDLPHAAQGAAFAAKARLHAGNLTPHTDRSTRVLCGGSARTVAAITDQALQGLPMTAAEMVVPSYEVWRQRIQLRFTRSESSRGCSD